MHCRSNRQCIREVVDVFARAREVGELGNAAEAKLDESVSNVVLNCLDVVSGYRFALGERGDVIVAELGDELAQTSRLLGSQSRCPELFALGQVQQPFDFDLNAGAVEPRLAEVLAEFGDLVAVAPVERAEGLDAERTNGVAPCRIPGSS